MSIEFLKKVRDCGDYIYRKGVTPFDLISWTYLIEMIDELSEAKLNNFAIQHELFKEVSAALYRKAKALDQEQNTDFYTKFLDNCYGNTVWYVDRKKEEQTQKAENQQ
jgi:hypothetical protein